ncbi:hypothetical protein GFY24_26285 [Nocardia sp. SYP-A9097]|uniref:hypothetical protein n=1 Tax=Nocardia sp. SYP-A9097 TaxID=2663237 RepID=UPI00129BBCC4|nr:hypothetical protein [Nocardia sp. SYP-A9097]MRH90906.1 hypothetical protein [Nocardia sp. SYP-A9097]
MKRSALLLLTTAGMVLAGAGVTEILGDASTASPPSGQTLAAQHYITDTALGEIQPSACVHIAPTPSDR